MDGGKLIRYGKITADEGLYRHALVDYNYFITARNIATKIMTLSSEFKPDRIVIEQTNQGRNRNSQKMLEFIHFAVLAVFYAHGYDKQIYYVDTSAWRKTLGLKLTKEQRVHNKSNSETKRKAKVKGLRHAPKKGEGKITWKHLSVEWANRTYNLELKLVQNDEADAIALCSYGLLVGKEINQTKVIETAFIDLKAKNKV